MTIQIKILLGLLLAAAIGFGITLFNGNPDPLIPETGTEGSPAIDDDGPTDDLKGEGKKPGDHADDREPVRVKAEGGTASGSTFEQGVRGILTDEHNQPIEGAQVFLMPGMGLESLKMFKLHQEGVRFAPPAETVTASGEPTTVSTKGRHDPCLLPRFVPMAEAMVALVLADHWLR